MKAEIFNALNDLGIMHSLLGRKYIETAIGILLERPDAIEKITKDLYPTVASKYNTTPSRVERAMRHAIEVTYNNTDISVIEKYFGNCNSFLKGKLTNGQFLAGLAAYLKQHEESMECPVCGGLFQTIYRAKGGKIVGCNLCLADITAEVQE